MWERYKFRALNVSEKEHIYLGFIIKVPSNKKSHKLRSHTATCSSFPIRSLRQAGWGLTVGKGLLRGNTASSWEPGLQRPPVQISAFSCVPLGKSILLCLFPHLLGWWLWEWSLSWKTLWLMSNTNWPYSTFILSTCLVIQWLPKTKSVKGAFFLHRKSNTEILRKTSLSIKNSTYLTASTQNRKHTGPSLPASTVTFLHQMLYILSRTSVPWQGLEVDIKILELTLPRFPSKVNESLTSLEAVKCQGCQRTPAPDVCISHFQVIKTKPKDSSQDNTLSKIYQFLWFFM